MWVRLPPRAPVFVLCFQLVDAPLRKLYLFCTCHLRSNDWIICPCALDVSLELLLARANPRAVMLFCDPHALVAEQNRDALYGHAREKQFNGKRIAPIPHAELSGLFRVRDYCRVTEGLSRLGPNDCSKRGCGSRTTRHSFLDSTGC